MSAVRPHVGDTVTIIGVVEAVGPSYLGSPTMSAIITVTGTDGREYTLTAPLEMLGGAL